jgi:hypothetical protein
MSIFQPSHTTPGVITIELKPIRSLDKKNMKVTFYLSADLYTDYKNLQKRAKSLGYKLDLSKDFSTWFARQLQDADVSLQKLEK